VHLKKTFLLTPIIIAALAYCVRADAQTSQVSQLPQPIPGSDVFTLKIDTEAFKAKGLIDVNSSELNGYIDKTIITKGVVEKTESLDNGDVIKLYVSNDFGYPAFIVVVQNKANKFDTPEFYFKNKRIKVVGKVIDKDHELLISIDNPNQIQAFKLSR